MRPGDHIFIVAEGKGIAGQILPAFIERALTSGGEAVLAYPSAQLATIHQVLGDRLRDLGEWERLGLVKFLGSETLSAVFQDPTVEGLMEFKRTILGGCDQAIQRDRSSLWLAGGIATHLLEEGHKGQAIYAELFCDSHYRGHPVATLCTYRPPVEDGVLEGLLASHRARLEYP
jgi:hypothetical protein